MKYIITILFLALTLQTQAQEKPRKNAKYEMQVSGNCEMCKKRIEKAAYSVAGVKSAAWSIEDQKLLVFINEDKTSIDKVAAAIAAAGHDTEVIQATDQAYNGLHGCCLYRK